MSNEYATYPCGPEKDGGGDPSRKAVAILAIPSWEGVHEAVIAADCLDLGTRLKPAWRTVDRGHYEIPDGAVVAVASPSGRAANRAYAARDGETVEVSIPEAEDMLDPPGVGRRAWTRRVVRSALTERPYRFTFLPGHGYESGVVYDWRGQEYVAACVRATGRYVWLRAVTYAEAQALGIA